MRQMWIGWFLLGLSKDCTGFVVRPPSPIIPSHLTIDNLRIPTQHQHISPKSTQLSLIPPQVSSILSSTFAAQGPVPLIQAVGINAALFGALQPKLFQVLTPSGYLSAFLLGCGLWHTLGWKGWLVAVAYLGLGSAVTKVKFQEKEAAGIAESRGGRRGPENVWGSAATGLVCAFLAVPDLVASVPVLGPTSLLFSATLWQLAFVASLATKLADTFASEIGKAYGKTTFLITTLERVPPGTEGAISLEGTLAAVVGGFLLSVLAFGLDQISFPYGVLISTIAAFLATMAESVLGAVLQDKPEFAWATNEVINFFNTVIGAGIALTLGQVLL